MLGSLNISLSLILNNYQKKYMCMFTPPPHPPHPPPNTTTTTTTITTSNNNNNNNRRRKGRQILWPNKWTKKDEENESGGDTNFSLCSWDGSLRKEDKKIWESEKESRTCKLQHFLYY